MKLKKIISCMALLTLLIIPSNSYAHTLGSGGSESAGWKYVGSHWPSTTTNYFVATNSTWESRFNAGITRFRNGTGGKFAIQKVSTGSSQNFIENYSSSSATWVAQRTFFGISNQHPTRWRIQFNSAKTANHWETVAAHEIGHIFGLGDLYQSTNTSKLMYGYDNGVRSVQPSDKNGLNYVYKVY